jgi:hypothetical protein
VHFFQDTTRINTFRLRTGISCEHERLQELNCDIVEIGEAVQKFRIPLSHPKEWDVQC